MIITHVCLENPVKNAKNHKSNYTAHVNLFVMTQD